MSNYDMPGNDYVSVAKFRLEGVHDQQSEEGMTDATMIAAALDAQTQATLALAYEQRTANLIAAFTLGKEQPREVFEAAVRDHDSEAAKVIAKWNGIGKQIEERLGFK